MKRIISFLLSVCLVLGLFPVTVKADEVQTKYLKVSVNEELKTYECLWDNAEIYCSLESLAEISNYGWSQVDDGLDYYFFKEYGELEDYSVQPMTDVVISVDSDKEEAYVEAMGESYIMDCYFVDEELFLPLEKLLYLLHVEWFVENDTVYATPMPLTILDFIAIHGIDLIEIATQSEEVLINTGWILSDTQFGQAVYSSIAEVFSDFDGKIFMFWLPGEGHVETAESYENAILQLAREDEEFITENIQQDALESAVDSAFYLHNNYMSKIQNIMAIPENIDDIVQSVPDAVALLEDMGKEVPKLKKIAEDIKDGKIDTLFLSNPELKATTKQLEQIGDGIAIMQCIWNVYDTATRVQGWDKEYLAQLQILADYQEFSCINESVANYVRDAAKRLIDSYNAPSEAATDEALQSTVGLLLSKTFDASPFGKAFSIMNAVGSCYGVYNADFADTYDMYAELSNVSFSVKVEQMVKYLLDYNHLFNSTEKLTNEKLEEYRNQLMLYLRLNLRNKIQLYNLNIKGNEDKSWAQSNEAKELYDEIVLVYVMLAELIESKEYDPFVVLESNLDNMYGVISDELYLKDVGHVPISNQILLDEVANYTASVSDAFNDTITDSMGKLYCYHIPQVNLVNNLGIEINSKIYQQLNSILIEQVDFNTNDKNYYPLLSGMVYVWGQKEKMISIVVETNQTDWAWTEYYVYNISSVTGKEISVEQLLEVYNLSKEDFYNLVRDTMKKHWNSRSDIISFVGQEQYNILVERTLEEQNVKTALPYINTNGELCIVANIYSPAGADSYLHLLNTVSGTDEGYLECQMEHLKETDDNNNLEIKVSEEEAINIAQEHWKHEIGDMIVIDETEAPVTIQVQGMENNEYIVALRWLVEDDNYSHWSTVDIICINATTGECRSYYE